MPWVCLQFVIVVVSDHTHLLFLSRRGPSHNNELAPMPRIHVVSPYCMVASLIKKQEEPFSRNSLNALTFAYPTSAFKFQHSQSEFCILNTIKVTCAWSISLT